MKNNLISIIVPVYNLDKYIERCINSIQNQTYENIEIIVVDDGSTDNSWNIISQLTKTDNRIKPIHKENGGVSSARMTGVDNASGEWIGFVDGDDEIEIDMYALLMKNALNYNVDISHCGYQMVFADGRINYFHNTKQIKIQDNITGIIDLLEGDLIEPGLCNKLYKKSLFNDVNLDNKIKINEDLLLNYYLFKNSKVSVFEDVTKYHYMIRNQSATRGKITYNKIYDPIKVKEIILSDADNSIKEEAYKVYLRTIIYIIDQIIIEDSNDAFEPQRIELTNLLKKHVHNIKLLNNKLKLSAYLIIAFPNIYKFFYKVYDQFRTDIYN